jgi:serine/threonine-protein kinase
MMPNPQNHLVSALADRYRIERELGAGGMATVYLAQDLRHDRKVAVKVLRPELAAVIGAERFLSEIKTTANLQHPHILPLFDSGRTGGQPDGRTDDFLFYVMPYIEGESLRDRLSREKQLPIADAVRIATEVSSALDYAHRHGVVHRDIKPENILLHDGQALVADFGIALAASKAGGSRMTETGMSLGTPTYMSPEQAMGEREITARSDVYALGCITYEMLVGEPPFSGPTAQSIVAKVMTEKPASLIARRDRVPPVVEDAVLTALEKLPADRYASAAEFAAALGGQSDRRIDGRTYGRLSSARPPVRPSALLVALAAMTVLAAGAAVLGWWPRGDSTPAVVRVDLQPSPGVKFAFPVNGIGAYLAVSPDGRQVVYAASRGGSDWTLHIRNLDQLDSRELPGTAGARAPEFSPDGRWIAFGAADGSVKKIATDGSSLTTVCELDPTGIVGLSWTSNREIVFSRINLAVGRGIWRVPAEGGEPVRFSKMGAPNERLQLAPRAADGGRLIFYTSGKAGNADLKIGVVTTATGDARMFPELQGFRALGLVDGQLLYVRGDGVLMAARFDTGKLTAGRPVPVLDSVTAPNWLVPAALSASGTLLYQRGGQASHLVRVDERGVAQRLLDSAQVYLHPRLSPDGRRIAYEVLGGVGTEIWIADIATQAMMRLTRDGYSDRPEWSPDGRRILYTSSRTPRNSLWWQPADGSGAAELVHESEFEIREGVFTPRGDAVVYRADTPDRNRDIYLVPLTGDRKPVPLLERVDDDKEPRVSPDGQWLAFVSNESGREEVYVRALANGGGRVPVSTSGGGEPLWAPDGRRLFYRVGPRLMAARIVTAPALAVAGRDTLFTGPFTTDQWHPDYDVAPDGKSFVMVRPVEENRQLIMVLHWTEELKQRLRTGD